MVVRVRGALATAASASTTASSGTSAGSLVVLPAHSGCIVSSGFLVLVQIAALVFAIVLAILVVVLPAILSVPLINVRVVVRIGCNGDPPARTVVVDLVALAVARSSIRYAVIAVVQRATNCGTGKRACRRGDGTGDTMTSLLLAG